ncbi:MAG TPA: hypothetical protein VK338_04660 [Candidatus Nitrosocosmicus sp.]|nr:hypothetical protein [Candidatus Nitrosocosmicus sp.]
MGNNRLIIGYGVAFFGFIAFLVIVGLVLKFQTDKTKKESENITMESPFSGRYNPRTSNGSGSNYEIVKSNSIPINSEGLIQKLPIKTNTFEATYDPTTNEFIVFSNDPSKAEEEFKRYLEKEKLMANSKNSKASKIIYMKKVSVSPIANNDIRTTGNPSTRGVRIDPRTGRPITGSANTTDTSGLGTSAQGTSGTEVGSNTGNQNDGSSNNTTGLQNSSDISVTPSNGNNTTPEYEGYESEDQKRIKDKFLKIFSGVVEKINQNASQTQTNTVNQAATPTSNIVPTTDSQTNIQETKADSIPINSSIFSDYGLPQPNKSGYEPILNRIRNNGNVKWSVENLLQGEKLGKQKGFNIKPYITTAWVWFEVDQKGTVGWPDVYGINCNDNRPGYTSEVSAFCPVNNFQIAGYQAKTRSNDYLNVYKRLYSDSDLRSVMQRVVSNSDKSVQPRFSYLSSNQQNKGLMQYLPNSEIPNNISIADIAANSSEFSNQRKQFFTLIIGKDPAMVAVLNSYAVSDGDLIRCLKTQSNCYGYINSNLKQNIANIMAALIIYDRGQLP